MMDAWWSEATKLEFKWQNGGTYTGGPFRGVIHTTEYTWYTPSKEIYYKHYDPPHFTMVMEAAGVNFYQHFPSPWPPARSRTAAAASRPTRARPSRSKSP